MNTKSTLQPPIKSLWIAGAGDLGWRVARQLFRKDLRLVLETRTPRRHPYYQILGAELKTTQRTPTPTAPCSHLLICFPPSENFEKEVEESLKNWNGEGSAVLVSSTSVYAEKDGREVNLQSPTLNTALSRAENFALKKGCHVLRLAGLYSAQSGPHVFWETRSVPVDSPKAMINLIHRHDAATAISLLLKANVPARTWNLSDGHAQNRQEVATTWMDFRGATPQLGPQADERGKIVSPDDSWTSVGWQPRWPSFSDFVNSLRQPRNVFGRPLKICSRDPVTGFLRDGCCNPNVEDSGEHTICCEMSAVFLGFSKAQGNDLSTPRPEFSFAGLLPGNQWCLCTPRWFEAWLRDSAPRIYLESCHESVLEWAPFKRLAPFALDLA